MYLVESNMTDQIPGLAAVSQHLVGTAVTDSNGSFNITGMPTEAVNPGNSSLVIMTKTLDYVGSPEGKLFTSRSFQKTPFLNPVPKAFAAASLAANLFA